MTTGDASVPLRLVLTQAGEPPTTRSTAWLFPRGASAFTPAVASFALSDTQELPPTAPGDVVWVDGNPTPGAAGVEVHADGVVLRPSGPVEGGMGRGFADVRGSRPLVHPAQAASLGPYARAWVAGDGVTKAAWDRCGGPTSTAPRPDARSELSSSSSPCSSTTGVATSRP